ncbi:hypothetical protein GCM10010423_12780 [Streptomyces levis]|uniref:Uncharacterized protein n=1 Tax=Streptomyces levis TaxID=285566 RepID=A0ABN3NIP6_9ACTN
MRYSTNTPCASRFSSPLILGLIALALILLPGEPSTGRMLIGVAVQLLITLVGSFVITPPHRPLKGPGMTAPVWWPEVVAAAERRRPVTGLLLAHATYPPSTTAGCVSRSPGPTSSPPGTTAGPWPHSTAPSHSSDGPCPSR